MNDAQAFQLIAVLINESAFIIEAASGLLHARKQCLRIGRLSQRGRQAQQNHKGKTVEEISGHSAFALSVATLS